MNFPWMGFRNSKYAFRRLFLQRVKFMTALREFDINRKCLGCVECWFVVVISPIVFDRSCIPLVYFISVKSQILPSSLNFYPRPRFIHKTPLLVTAALVMITLLNDTVKRVNSTVSEVSSGSQFLRGLVKYLLLSSVDSK